jgi:hypothetical protein
MQFSSLPGIGTSLDGGLFAGLTTTPDGQHHAVVLLPDKPDDKLTWEKAMNWAEKAGGALPTRLVASLLFVNAKAQFDPEWHWTSEALDGSYAWLQYFSDGYQLSNRKSYEGRCRAVRLIQLTA